MNQPTTFSLTQSQSLLLTAQRLLYLPPEDVTIENFVTITTINAYMRGRGSE